MTTSWIEIDSTSDFSLQNLPYGVFSTDGTEPRPGVAIGQYILDLQALSRERCFAALGFDVETLQQPTLNAFAELDKSVHRRVRNLLQELLSANTPLGPELRDNDSLRQKVLVPMSEAQMHLPMTISNYTDFFVGLNHALNCTEIFQPGAQLPPSYLGMPIAYHGRASSIVMSETPVRRPWGQYPRDGVPTFGPCQKLDFEVEFAAFVGRGNHSGSSIDVNVAEEHIFGVVLMNDWSARDIQQWESIPLGPFNGKNFCTTISPWIVTLDALEAFRTTPQRPGPWLPYLDQAEKKSVHDIPIQVFLENDKGRFSVAECNTKHVLFSFAQMIAHHTAGGCPLQTGDLIATGTLSGPTQRELGCLLEITRNGTSSYEMPAASSTQKSCSRRWLEDGDTVEFTAQAQSAQGNVGFGSCKGLIIASS